MVKRLFFLLFLFVAFQSLGQEQEYTTNKKKAIEAYLASDNFYVRGQYKAALDLLNEAIRRDDMFSEAYYKKGLIFYNLNQYERAIELFKLSLRNAPKGYVPKLNFVLGELNLKTGNYKEAMVYLKGFLIFKGAPKPRIELAEKYLQDCEYALANPDPRFSFSPKPLPDHVNKYALQYFPVLTADNNQLIFTRRNGTTMEYDEDLVISYNDGREWSDPRSLSTNINSSYNEGTCSISADGRILIFTSCERNVFGSCDLFISEKTGEVWSYPENLGEAINSPAWESQPSLSADGRTLYFISTRNGGYGRRDIWYSIKDENDRWTIAKNLGRAVNTYRDEVSPFIHVNGETLYFASNGYPGYGGYDLYYTNRKDTTWSEPMNVGFPLNTYNDEVSLFITSDGSKGYYSFEVYDEQGRQRSTLYEFEIESDIGISRRSSYVYGRVRDAETKKELSATIELHDLANNQLINKVHSDAVNGEYLIVLTEGAEYALHVTKPGYLFKSLTFNYESDRGNEPIELDIYLEKVEKGRKVVLNNLYFDFDSYSLRDKSKTELDKLIEFLGQNQNLSIEIEGHTDDQGSEQYNLELSKNRAKAVYDYLLEKGINRERLAFKGYGKSQPIVPNTSEENRQLNRRIDFRVL